MATKALSDTELSAIVTHQIALAKDHDKTEREKPRDKAMDYYLGTMTDTPSEPNRSSVVSRDVADTIGWIHPGIMRVFTATDRMFLAEPVAVEDMQHAHDVTAGLNYVFWKENKGYDTVYNGTWDALLDGNGIIKTYWDDEPKHKISFHSGLSDDQLALLLQAEDDDDGIEVLAHSDHHETQIDPASGLPTPVVLHDVKIKRKVADGGFVVECIPPEDFLKDPDSIDLDDARFLSHRDHVTRSDLIGMGYDPAKVKTIPVSVRKDDPEAIARQHDGMQQGDSADTSTELVRYFESYVRIDVDGDGEAELVRVCSAGDDGSVLLDWEEWEDENPFDDIRCEPIPHRWAARSIADETMDVQRIKTVLWRNALDNTYARQNPQRLVSGDVLNLDALMNPEFGGVILGKTGTTIVPLELPDVTETAFNGINYLDQVIQRRTGVSRQTMALDPEALMNQSATANQNEKDASYSQIELLARNMAMGWERVGRKLMRLMIKHQAQPKKVLIKGEPKTIDPRYWNADMHISINVGLGTGSRDRDAAAMMTIIQQQIAFTDRIGAVFPDKGLDMLEYLHNSLTHYAESVGLPNPEMYWPAVDPKEIDAGKKRLAEQAQQGDPKTAAIEAKAQSDQQLAQIKAQGEMQSQQANAQIAQVKAQAEVTKAQYEVQLGQLKMQLAQQQMQDRDQIAGMKLQLDQQAAAGKNLTDLRKTAMQIQGQLDTARISAGLDQETLWFSKFLDALIGVQEHQQNMELQAAKPTPQPGTAG